MTYSIITPVYNRQDCISRCIESVIRNLNKDIVIEHIIVDDGSVDRTPDIVQEYADQYSHIKFVRFDRNRGTNAARNAAVKVASGDYCILLDSDDYFVDNAMSIVIPTLTNHKYLHYFFLSDDTEDLHRTWNVLRGKDSAVVTYEDLLLGRVDGDFIHVIYREILKKFPFDEYLRINEGVFFMQFHREEKEIWFTRKIITIRERSRSDSVTRLTTRSNIEDVKRALSASTLRLNLFGEDLKKFPEGKIKIANQLKKIIDYNLIIGNYQEADKAIRQMRELGVGNVSVLFLIIYKFRLGKLYFFIGTIYTFVKYQVFNKKVK